MDRLPEAQLDDLHVAGTREGANENAQEQHEEEHEGQEEVGEELDLDPGPGGSGTRLHDRLQLLQPLAGAPRGR